MGFGILGLLETIGLVMLLGVFFCACCCYCFEPCCQKTKSNLGEVISPPDPNLIIIQQKDQTVDTSKFRSDWGHQQLEIRRDQMEQIMDTSNLYMDTLNTQRREQSERYKISTSY